MPENENNNLPRTNNEFLEQINRYIYLVKDDNKTLEKRNTKSIFMNIDMYRDEENHEENPVFIENSLSIFESEISNLINNKLLNDKALSLEEISDACGFHSTNYFSRRFRKEYGYAPGRSRNMGK